MISRVAIVILLGLVGYLGYQDFYLGQERAFLVDELARQKALATQEKKSIEELNQKLQTESTQLAAKADQLKMRDQRAAQNLKNLRNRLLEQRDKLEALHQTIQDRRQHPKDPVGDLNSQLQKNRDQIRDLETKLKAARNAEKGIGHAQSQADRNLQRQSQAQTQSLTEQIKAQEQTIKASQSQLQFWQRRRNDPNREDRIAEYDAQIQKHRTALNKLRQQKAVVGKALQSQSAEVQGQANIEATSVQDSEAQIQDQIKRLKQDQRVLQSGQNKIEQSSRTEHEELHKLEEQYAIEYAKYQSIETALRARMQEFAKSKTSSQ